MKKIHVLGGGTQFHVRPHLALSAPAGGTTARAIAHMIEYWPNRLFEDAQVHLHLTKMASFESKIDTNSDVERLIDAIVADPESKMVFFSVALCDYEGSILDSDEHVLLAKETLSGKDQPRLQTRKGSQAMVLTPAPKVIRKIRETRKDIFLIGFKTTAGATQDEQFDAGLRLCKETHCNLVLANDLHTRLNMIITPEQSRYSVTTDRKTVLSDLVEIAGHRSRGTFARCKVVNGDLYDFSSPEIPDSLKSVVKFCVRGGAYLPFHGKCAGHFAVKKPDGSVICSIRGSNYNESISMVKLDSSNDHEVTAHGARPSAGARSQWIMFNKRPELDCVVHFHCPLKPGKFVNSRPQKNFECGSHECGHNTADGLSPVSDDGQIQAVYLDNHGPNILFNSRVDPASVIAFIEDNFDLSKTTRGYEADKS